MFDLFIITLYILYSDINKTGNLGLNEFLSAFENLKIANVEASDLKMVFGIFDLQKKSEINYSVFLQELF